jgi:hypothetical protein
MIEFCLTDAGEEFRRCNDMAEVLDEGFIAFDRPTVWGRIAPLIGGNGRGTEEDRPKDQQPKRPDVHR